ncbi:unnamed protein product [Dicrocoelium dendriticum]|nr:unnamed protein product [Dicrocoelium dendriticum]
MRHGPFAVISEVAILRNWPIRKRGPLVRSHPVKFRRKAWSFRCLTSVLNRLCALKRNYLRGVKLGLIRFPMLPMLTPSIVLQLLLALYLLTKQGVASSSGHPIHWNFVGHTTIAVTPKIMCAYSSFPPPGLSVEWIVDTTNSEKYRLEAVPSVDAEIVRKRSQMVRFGVDRIGLNLVLQLTAIQSTSQGEARLPIRLKIDENVLQTMDSRPLALHLVQHLSSAGDSIISHTLWWNPLSNSASYVDDYVVLVYNSTHVMQTEAKERQISLSNLSPGTVYKMCVVQADTVCRGVEWSCLTSILPLHRNDLVPSPGADVRHLSVLAVDATSVQLLWLPPARSTRTANMRAPRFYFIVLLPGRELRSCSLQTFYVQAPWSQPADYQLFTELASAALSQFIPEGCLQKRPKPVQLYPVGVWPDWEKYDEQLDGWGRVGDFVVTIDGLTPNQEYSLHLSPIYSESYGEMTTTRFATTSLGDGCNLRLESVSGKESRLIWRIPTYIMKRISPTESFVFQVDIERIGRPPLETLTDMCFVKSCTMGTASKPQFQPQSANEAQRVLCQRSQVPLDPINFEQVIQLSCLLPCVVYQINVTLLSNDLGDPEGFSCQRRVIRPGQTPRPMSNLRASALSHDMILIHLDKEQHVSTHDYCAPVGYAIRLSDPTTLESTSPMLLTLEDLAGGSHLPLVSPSWTSDDSSYNMLLTHPLVNATKLHLTVESFATSMSPGVKADVNLRNLEFSCQADCLWPSIAPFTLFHSITGRDYRGQYASYRSMRESRHQLFQCGRSLTSARKQMTRCMAPNGFILSNQAYCQSEDGFNFCAIPRCNEMGVLMIFFSAFSL